MVALAVACLVANGEEIKTGLWLELEATIGFLVGLGLGSLLGQRTVSVILMIVLEIMGFCARAGPQGRLSAAADADWWTPQSAHSRNHWGG